MREKNRLNKIFKKRTIDTYQLDLGYPFLHDHLEVLRLVDQYHPLGQDCLVDLVGQDNLRHPKRNKAK